MDPEVLKLLQRLEAGVEPTENAATVPHGDRPCPICGKKMAIDYERGIQTDVCSEHGVWLDVGELGLIMLHVRMQQRRLNDGALREAIESPGIWSFLDRR